MFIRSFTSDHIDGRSHRQANIIDRWAAFTIISVSLFLFFDPTTKITAMQQASSIDTKWNKQHLKLVEFKGKNGHCLVPNRYKEDKAFGKWVSKQRGLHVNNKLRLDRKELLDKIGFVWIDNNTAALVSCYNQKWNKQYEKLVEFKRKNGHCIVPQKRKEDKSLGKWVNNQRTRKTYRQDRKDLLDALGFVWNDDHGDDDDNGDTDSSGLMLPTINEFIGVKKQNDILLVYPFAGDKEMIEKAADTLNEAKANPIPYSVSRGAIKKGKGNRQHYVTVVVEDYERLYPGEWLNDTLIDFWMRW
jgi:hypothetical protein